MQPADFDDDRPSPPYRDEPAPTSIPKTIGILNIIFGGLLLLCSICTGVGLAMQSAMGPMFAAQQQQFQQLAEAERQKQLQDLQNRERGAQNAEEKAELQAQAKALKARPLPKMPDMSKFSQEASLQGYSIVDVVTGLTLNVLLVICGIGLVCYREWARRLAIWVAAVKILRLVVLYGFFILIVVPRVTRAFTSMFQEMIEQMGKNVPPGQEIPKAAEIEQMGTVIGMMYAGFGIGMIILGAVYPIIVLMLLTRPRVKAACLPAPPAWDPRRQEEG
jgi:hypothetical protein